MCCGSTVASVYTVLLFSLTTSLGHRIFTWPVISVCLAMPHYSYCCYDKEDVLGSQRVSGRRGTLVRLLVRSHLVNYQFICITTLSTSTTFSCIILVEFASLTRTPRNSGAVASQIQPHRSLCRNRCHRLSLPIRRILEA